MGLLHDPIWRTVWWLDNIFTVPVCLFHSSSNGFRMPRSCCKFCWSSWLGPTVMEVNKSWRFSRFRVSFWVNWIREQWSSRHSPIEDSSKSCGSESGYSPFCTRLCRHFPPFPFWVACRLVYISFGLNYPFPRDIYIFIHKPLKLFTWVRAVRVSCIQGR